MTDRPWWHKERHADRRPLLIARSEIKAAFRRWFEDRGFVEVETACLQISPGNEAHLHAFSTMIESEAGHRRPLYLHTSPEFACKKLLAAGERAIFTFAPVFRNRERGPLHHHEFTMLEWYRVGEPYDALMRDCAELLALAAATAGTDLLSWRGEPVDPLARPERLTLAEAFRKFARIDLLATLTGAEPDQQALADGALRAGVRVAPDDSWSDIFSRVLVDCVEPHIGRGRATILMEYPTVEAALARPRPRDPRVAERFELYACGVEIANGFAELTDVREQRRRFELEMEEKARRYGERYPIDEDFLAALAQMPPASGIALGFDRLVMLATGASSIDKVIWTPVVTP